MFAINLLIRAVVNKKKVGWLNVALELHSGLYYKQFGIYSEGNLENNVYNFGQIMITVLDFASIVFKLPSHYHSKDT